MVVSDDWFWTYIDMIMQASWLPDIIDFKDIHLNYDVLAHNDNEILLVISLYLIELERY